MLHFAEWSLGDEGTRGRWTLSTQQLVGRDGKMYRSQGKAGSEILLLEHNRCTSNQDVGPTFGVAGRHDKLRYMHAKYAARKFI